MTIDELKNKNIGFISLGCDKNRVDLERIINDIHAFGFNIVNDPSKANIIIVNTCSFLESARLESIENILDMSKYKNDYLEKLIVTGCLNELNYSDLQEALPEVDLFVNIKDNKNILQKIASLYNVYTNFSSDNGRYLTTLKHYAYLKISEGCNNFCSYCLIPYIRGRYKSTPIEELIKEAKLLVSSGVKELILVAQDVTKYGVDLYGEKRIVELIKELSKINNLKWIRLLYCYPEEIDDKLIDEISNNPKVVKYLDIPLQHISDNVLKSMNRRSTYNNICSLFTKLKTKIPSLTFRTTFIVGFPNETLDDVELVANFLKEYKLDNVGFFAYSREEGTRSYNFDNQIDEDEKQRRLEYLSNIQYNIQFNHHQNLVGKIVDVIIDEVQSDYSIGRFYGQCPMIDSCVYINEILNVGEIYSIKITKKLDYDFEGEII